MSDTDSQSMPLSDSDADAYGHFLDQFTDISKARLAYQQKKTDDCFSSFQSSLPEISLPSWFPNQAMHEKILHSYFNEYRQLLQTKQILEKYLDDNNYRDKKRGQTDEDVKIAEADRKIKNLQQALDDMRQQKLADAERRQHMMSAVQSKKYMMENLQIEIQDLQQKKDQAEVELNKIFTELQDLTDKDVKVVQVLKQSERELDGYQRTLTTTKNALDDFVRQRNELSKSNDELQAQIQTLETDRIDAEFRIKQLQDQLADHEQLVSAFDIAKKQLAREQATEKKLIDKMQDALQTTDEMKESAERFRTEALSMRDEVKRSEQEMKQTLTQMKEAARQKVETEVQAYQNKVSDADKQVHQLLNSNAHISASIESMRRQISFLEAQNAVLRSDDNKGRSNFEEFGRGADAQLEQLNRELEELTREEQQIKEEERSVKAKLTQAESDVDRAVNSVRTKVERLETDLAQMKATHNEIESAYSAKVAESERLSSEESRIAVESKHQMEIKLAEKETEFRRLRSRLDEISREYNERKQELQRLLEDNKRHTQKCQDAAKTAAEMGEAAIDKTESIAQQYQQQSNALSAEIDRMDGELQAQKERIAKMFAATRSLQVSCDSLEKRVEEQKSQREGTNQELMQLMSEKGTIVEEIERTRVERRRIRSKLAMTKEAML